MVRPWSTIEATVDVSWNLRPLPRLTHHVVFFPFLVVFLFCGSHCGVGRTATDKTVTDTQLRRRNGTSTLPQQLAKRDFLLVDKCFRIRVRLRLIKTCKKKKFCFQNKILVSLGQRVLSLRILFHTFDKPQVNFDSVYSRQITNSSLYLAISFSMTIFVFKWESLCRWWFFNPFLKQIGMLNILIHYIFVWKLD